MITLPNQTVIVSLADLEGFAQAVAKEALKQFVKNKDNIATLANTTDDIVGAEGACELLGIEKQTLYSKTSNGAIPFFKSGKKLLFSKKALIDWIRSHEKNAVAK